MKAKINLLLLLITFLSSAILGAITGGQLAVTVAERYQAHSERIAFAKQQELSEKVHSLDLDNVTTIRPEVAAELTVVGVREEEVRDSLLRLTFQGVCEVESNGNPFAYNSLENAKGIVQIRPIMVKDVNRILGRETYVHDDAYDPMSSWLMFKVYSLKYAPNGSPEVWARNWNGGPSGAGKSSTLLYWEKVRAFIEPIYQAELELGVF